MKVIVGATVAAGTLTVAGLLYLYKKKLDATPPTKWRKVGQIVDINCFPIKSCASIKRKTYDCHVLGLNVENIGDRSFMVISTEGNFVTGRTYPKLLFIKPKIRGNKLILSAPDKPDIEVNVDELKKQKPSKAFVWRQEVNAIDVGDAVADWISEFILGTKGGLRMVFYPDSYSTRPSRFPQFKLLTKVDSGALQDMTSYMLMNQASVDELNTHLDHKVNPLQFRPNYVVKGPGAYEEDNWKWVRIGEDVIFRNIKPCTRCVFTTINPETGVRDPNRQPLKTLKELRTIIPNVDLAVMGIHLGLRTKGKVSIGDAVYVEA